MRVKALYFIVAVVLAVGCTGEKGDKKAATAKRIAWYAPVVHPYFEDVKKGISGFEKDSGLSVKRQIGQEWSQDNENANVESLAAKGYKAFAICPADASAANGLYEELSANGAFVISYGAPTTLPTTASFCVATDVKAAAQVATHTLIAAMGGKGNILNVLELIEDPNTVLRKQGIEEAIDEYPDVRIVQEIAGMVSIEESTAKIQNALAARIDEIDGIICTGYTPTVAAATILSEWHQTPGNKRIRFVGIDTDETVLQAIENGHMDATISQNPYGQGYIPCALLSYLLDGWTANQDTYFIDTGTIVVTRGNTRTFEREVKAITAEIIARLETDYLHPPQ